MKSEDWKKITKTGVAVLIIVMMLSVIFVPLSPPKASAAMGSDVMGPGGLAVPHYFGPYPNYATSDLPSVTYNPDGSIASVTGGIRKFMDSLPGFGEANANDLGQYIPIAVSDTQSYPGSDYYEIALVEFREKMHPDIPATKLRGYVQLETTVNFATSKHIPLTYLNGTPVLKYDGSQAIAYDNPHYLGPFIVAMEDTPVRVKFINLLPTGEAGKLFLPVDKTIMGAGMGNIPMMGLDGMPMLNPDGSIMYEEYTENRATLHLHGGRTPWISDGTPHQWITPANENTVYPEGVSVYDVPDMGVQEPGSQTFYYTNAQSARLMFYHDHAYGITRLNVYAGETAGYIVRDSVELALISNGIIPSAEIPLVIQDKTFVPNMTTPIENMWGMFDSQLAFQDPTWNSTMWGSTGDLWYPHVYMTMANPADPSGQSMFGRWMYSPWFWPPKDPTYGPVLNPYYDPLNPNDPMEPMYIPGTPNPSSPGEAFMDTPVINGAAYPYLEVDPQAYRFRILNAADDRFFNLQLYVADPTVTTFDGRLNTEVKMVPAVPTIGHPEGWPIDGREGGVPDPATVGPEMIQIGNEAGFLPAPVVLPNQPVDWNMNMGNFDMGILNKYTLLLGSAERADVIVDFSQYAGQTLILYNDCPAPTPAGDPRQDYYTGHPDMTEEGGSQTTIPGYGSNTRTLMQIRVSNNAAAAPFDIAALNAAFNTTGTQDGVFKQSQNDIIVPQAYYNSAYNATWTNQFANIYSRSLTFTPIGSTTPVTIPFEMKAIQDEMGEAYDHEYGRMAVHFGIQVETTLPQAQTLILYGFASPPTEVMASDMQGTLLGTLSDGTQIWNIVHNGVDTHPVHWHMFEVQLINRVAWDNNIREPDANELGWKETLRVNPLQNTIVALRPVVPDVPWDIPNSERLLDPTSPDGAILETNAFSVNAEPITVVNHVINFGWEYVWHCHILAHEENDMMRTMAVAVSPVDPSGLTAVKQGGKMVLNWADNSLGESGFLIQRATDANFLTGVVSFEVGKDVTTYEDTTIAPTGAYWYRVYAINTVGDTWDYAAAAGNPGIQNFPTVTVSSGPSNVVGPPAGVIKLVSVTQTGARGAPVLVKWTYMPSGSQSGFLIQRSTSPLFNQNLQQTVVGPNVFSYSDRGFTPGVLYYYRVTAIGSGGPVWSNTLSIVPHR
ncbi:MAG: multicopper oxidase domain-containing protein [Euryarchaeota archaeon]|nr:multicopper oxidase domain-containing protein [Euryarchaeota archaeon]